MISCLFAMSLANAGPTSPSRPEVVWVEQARVALVHDRPDLARAYSMKALNIDPEAWDAWRLYLRGSAETGLRQVAEAELASLNDPGAAVALAWWKVSSRQAPVESLNTIDDPRARVAYGWSVLARGREREVLDLKLPPGPLSAKLRLRALAMTGERNLLKREAKEWLRRHPESPHVLAELWGPNVPDTPTQRMVLKTLRKRVEAGESDPAWLILAARTFVAAKDREMAAVVAGRVDDQGLLAPLNRKPWGTSMRKAMGKALVGQDPLVMPAGSDAEQAELATRVAAEWLVRDRIDEAVGLLEGVNTGAGEWRVARGLALAKHAAGDQQGAQASLTEALQATMGHWSSDPCGLDLHLRAAAASEVLGDAATLDMDLGTVAEQVATALSGDLVTWRSLVVHEGDKELDWCLAAAAGTPMEGGWHGPVPDIARDLLPELHTSALALVPEELLPTKKPQGIPEPGEPFPDVVLPLESGAVTLREAVARRPGLTVLSLWATWCGPCQLELPLIDELVGRLQAEGIDVDAVAISIDDDERAYRRHLQRKPFTNLEAGRSPSILGAVGGASLPVTWLIDDDGRVVLVHVGYDPELPGRIEAHVRGG